MTETNDELQQQAPGLSDEQIERLVREGEAAQARFAAVQRQEIFDLETMLQRFAYLRHEDRIVDLRTPALTYSRQGFRNLTAASVRIIIGARGGERAVPIADDWLQHDARIDLEGVTFRPNAPRLTTNIHGRPAVNMWSAPRISEQDAPFGWQHRANVFTAHMEYLIPDAIERNNVVRWLAHRVQKPEVLPGWHVLLVAEGAQGTGRNWVARCMKSLLPEHTVEALPLKRILDGNFNGELDRAVLGIVDEIREGGGDYWKHAEALKSFLSEKTRVINQKYRVPYEVQNFLGVMMFSNHIDALPISEEDRRHYVARCTTQPKPAEYFDLIYDALKDPVTLRAIYEHLMSVDLRGFAIEGRAPESDVKREMIAESRADEETELRRIIAEWPSDVMRSATLRMMLQAFRDNDLLFGEDRHKSDQLSTGQLRRLYRVCGVKTMGQVRMIHIDPSKGRTETWFRIVVLRNYRERWAKAAEADLRAEIERGEAEHEAAQRATKDGDGKPAAAH
jgi:hypothetical protein